MELFPLETEIARRKSRLSAIAQAKAKIEQCAAKRHQGKWQEYETKMAKCRAQRAAGQKPRGEAPDSDLEALQAAPREGDQIDLTDEQSRIMPFSDGGLRAKLERTSRRAASVLRHHQAGDGLTPDEHARTGQGHAVKSPISPRQRPACSFTQSSDNASSAPACWMRNGRLDSGRHGQRCGIYRMHLNHAFGQINLDTHHFTHIAASCNLAHGLPLSIQQYMDESNHPSWRIDAVARRWQIPCYFNQPDTQRQATLAV